MDDVEDDAGSQSGSSEGIPASLRYTTQGARTLRRAAH